MTSTPLEREWAPYDPCPCECVVVSSKLSLKTGHVHGCECVSCRNRRNQKKGKRGEYNRHKRLGGQGFTPHDEMGVAYSVEVVTQDKKGKQVPAAFTRFVRSEWFRHALSQAERVIPAGQGVQAHPALYLEPEGGGAYVVVKVA